METVQQLADINLGAVFLSILGILAALKYILSIFEWALSWFGIETKWMRRKREEHELLTRTVKRVDKLEKKQNHDVEESIRHDNMIKEDLSKVVNSLEIITKKLDEMEKKNDDSERAKLKDRIAQAYRKHNETKKWTKMDKEAYEGLIRDYEAHKGKNSFVHDICEPESYTWELID